MQEAVPVIRGNRPGASLTRHTVLVDVKGSVGSLMEYPAPVRLVFRQGAIRSAALNTPMASIWQDDIEVTSRIDTVFPVVAIPAMFSWIPESISWLQDITGSYVDVIALILWYLDFDKLHFDGCQHSSIQP
jgi:hypothetical protein